MPGTTHVTALALGRMILAHAQEIITNHVRVIIAQGPITLETVRELTETARVP